MSETRAEQIERLKSNERTIYRDMESKDKNLLTELGWKYCQRLTCDSINRLFWDDSFEPHDHFLAVGIYRIRPDYHEKPLKPETQDCEVFKEGNRLKYKREYLSAVPIEQVVSEADFAGFFFREEGRMIWMETSLEQAARHKAANHEVIAKFRKD